MVDYKQFGRYQVTRDGKVYGIDGNRMKTQIDKDGYETVALRADNRKKYVIKVHRLVATRYIPAPAPSFTVNHKDGNKLNNDVNNLEWLSNADNLKHSWRCLNRKHFTKRIENSKGEVFDSAKEAAQKYGVKIAAISNCATGRTKTCAGMEWRYM